MGTTYFSDDTYFERKLVFFFLSIHLIHSLEPPSYQLLAELHCGLFSHTGFNAARLKHNRPQHYETFLVLLGVA